jgi:hypothetical protein
MEVATEGWPVMTPKELVWVKNEVWGKASPVKDEAAAEEDGEALWAKAAAAKTETKTEARILVVLFCFVWYVLVLCIWLSDCGCQKRLTRGDEWICVWMEVSDWLSEW